MLALGRPRLGVIFDTSLSPLAFFGSAMGFFSTPEVLKEPENFSSFLSCGLDAARASQDCPWSLGSCPWVRPADQGHQWPLGLLPFQGLILTLQVEAQPSRVISLPRQAAEEMSLPHPSWEPPCNHCIAAPSTPASPRQTFTWLRKPAKRKIAKEQT